MREYHKNMMLRFDHRSNIPDMYGARHLPLGLGRVGGGAGGGAAGVTGGTGLTLSSDSALITHNNQ